MFAVFGPKTKPATLVSLHINTCFNYCNQTRHEARLGTVWDGRQLRRRRAPRRPGPRPPLRSPYAATILPATVSSSFLISYPRATERALTPLAPPALPAPLGARARGAGRADLSEGLSAGSLQRVASEGGAVPRTDVLASLLARGLAASAALRSTATAVRSATAGKEGDLLLRRRRSLGAAHGRQGTELCAARRCAACGTQEARRGCRPTVHASMRQRQAPEPRREEIKWGARTGGSAFTT